MENHLVSTTSWMHLQQRLFGLPAVKPELQLQRPPLDLDERFSDAIAFSKDCLATESQDGAASIPALALAFANHPNFPHLLAAADEEGVVHFRNTQWGSPSQGPIASRKVHTNAIFEFKFIPQDSNAKFITASGDRNLILFDPQENGQLGKFEGHLGSVKCLDFQKDGEFNVFASGARDGHIMLWDTRSGARGMFLFSNLSSAGISVKLVDGNHYPVGYLVNAHAVQKSSALVHRRSYRHAPRHRSVNTYKFGLIYGAVNSNSIHQSVTDIVFQDANTFFSCGTSDNAIKFWDLRKLSQEKAEPVYKLQLEPGTTGPSYSFTSLCLDNTRTRLFASCMDKTIYRFDVGPTVSPVPVAQYNGANIGNFYIKCSLNMDGELLGCGSQDGNGYVFNVHQPEKAPIMLIGHSNEVMSVAFNHMDPYQLATHGDDDRVFVWRSELYLDRTNPPDIAGRAVRDSRSLDERTPIRRPRSRVSLTVDPKTPTVDTWVRRLPASENDSPTPTPRTPRKYGTFKTPRKDFQKKKRLRNSTLSPFLKSRNAPGTA